MLLRIAGTLIIVALAIFFPLIYFIFLEMSAIDAKQIVDSCIKYMNYWETGLRTGFLFVFFYSVLMVALAKVNFIKLKLAVVLIVLNMVLTGSITSVMKINENSTISDVRWQAKNCDKQNLIAF